MFRPIWCDRSCLYRTPTKAPVANSYLCSNLSETNFVSGEMFDSIRNNYNYKRWTRTLQIVTYETHHTKQLWQPINNIMSPILFWIILRSSLVTQADTICCKVLNPLVSFLLFELCKEKPSADLLTQPPLKSGNGWVITHHCLNGWNYVSKWSSSSTWRKLTWVWNENVPGTSRWGTGEWASYQIHKIASYACTENAGNVFPGTAGKRSRHASRHVRDARAVMHAGINN